MLVSLKIEVLLRQRQSNFASVSKLGTYLQTTNAYSSMWIKQKNKAVPANKFNSILQYELCIIQVLNS